MVFNNGVILQWISAILPHYGVGNNLISFTYNITLNKVFVILNTQEYYGFFFTSKGAVNEYSVSGLTFLQFVNSNESPQHKIYFIIIGS